MIEKKTFLQRNSWPPDVRQDGVGSRRQLAGKLYDRGFIDVLTVFSPLFQVLLLSNICYWLSKMKVIKWHFHLVDSCQFNIEERNTFTPVAKHLIDGDARCKMASGRQGFIHRKTLGLNSKFIIRKKIPIPTTWDPKQLRTMTEKNKLFLHRVTLQRHFSSRSHCRDSFTIKSPPDWDDPYYGH